MCMPISVGNSIPRVHIETTAKLPVAFVLLRVDVGIQLGISLGFHGIRRKSKEPFHVALEVEIMHHSARDQFRITRNSA